ncbi:MAG: DUF2089 domain-containing protein [Chloroflexi bacterium]|nr:DUF2089 domain-containing protein [Chloroflexota bacterium]
MATIEERMKILKLIEDGKITAEEGAKLLAALADSRRTQPPAGASARWFRVRVTDVNTGKMKVNVNLPMTLVNVGLKMSARFAPELDQDQMNQIAEALRNGAMGKVLDVVDQEDGEHVEVFIE